MRVGRVPVIPYSMPGSPEIGPEVVARAADHAAMLIANHGPVVAGASLEAAIFAMEELEETAKLICLAEGMPMRMLSDQQVLALKTRFPIR
jgi:ribulose-5-phosphate 4-epimerase/fuculose-1-phosphate aldolase